MKRISPLHCIVIRRMRRQDAIALAKMMKGLATCHGDTSIIHPHHFIRYCLGPRALSKAWIVSVDQKPVGFAVAYDWMNFVRAKPVRTLDLLYVDRSYRHLGLGKALVAFLAKDARYKGFLRFDTSAAMSNHDANCFYEHLGFEVSKHASQRYTIEGKAFQKLTHYQ